MAFGAIGVCLLVGVVVVAVAFVVFINGLDSGPTGRKHLKSIPIASSACPYVRVMHAVANEVQLDEPITAINLAVPGGPVTIAWPRSRVRFDLAIGRLELAILASESHIPAQVRQYLNVTLTDVRTGRTLLKTDRSGSYETNVTLAQRYQSLFSDGQQAFGYAGDLIGKQCGVQLGADSNTMPSSPFALIYPSTTTTLHRSTITQPFTRHVA